MVVIMICVYVCFLLTFWSQKGELSGSILTTAMRSKGRRVLATGSRDRRQTDTVLVRIQSGLDDWTSVLSHWSLSV